MRVTLLVVAVDVASLGGDDGSCGDDTGVGCFLCDLYREGLGAAAVSICSDISGSAFNGYMLCFASCRKHCEEHVLGFYLA